MKYTNRKGRPRIDRPALLSPSIKDIAFAAGFYEGEGCIDKNYQVSILQNDREILDRLREQFGGKVYGPYSGSSGNVYHTLTLSGPRAIGFLLTIYTFLSKQRKLQIKNILIGEEHGREYKSNVSSILDKSIEKLDEEDIIAKFLKDMG